MKKTYALALNTFREAVRNRILYTIFAFALIMIVSSVLLGTIMVGNKERIILDVGFGCISIFSMLISIFLGISLVSREIEKKTLYTIVTKPISRLEFLLGKTAGLIMTVFVIEAIMTLVLFVVHWIYTGSWNSLIVLPPFMTFFESIVIISFAVLFSSYSNPILAAMFTLTFYVVGNLSWGLKLLIRKLESSAFKLFFSGLYHLLPNLELFHYGNKVTHSLTINYGNISLSVLYSVVYSFTLLIIAWMIFENKDLV